MAKASTKPSKGETILEFDTAKIKAREDAVAKETDAEILERLGERFNILTDRYITIFFYS